MDKGNCIYIDVKGKWWIANTEDAFGDHDIVLIEEKTDELKKIFKEDFIKFAEAAAPHILYIGEDSICGTSAKNRKTISQN